MNPPVRLEQLIQRFDAPSVHAIVLMGSYTRGEAGHYSDIDVVRFTDGTELTGAGSYLIYEHLIVVSNVAPEQVVQSPTSFFPSWF